jgi:2-polyprenyl-3-methyl-5-hydroxy-6-metoxy-1,4-benzoquinol methylase
MDKEPNSYDFLAEHYDVLERDGEAITNRINDFLDSVFKKHHVKAVLDVACGTGAQAIGLVKKGYQVNACDYSSSMLNLARKKAVGINLCFEEKDMRSSQYGQFDAVIAIFNVVAHVNKEDLKKTLKNIWLNLRKGGLFIFDIINLECIMKGNNSVGWYIDTINEASGIKYVRFTKEELNKSTHLLKVSHKTYVQKPNERMVSKKESWELQLYTEEELMHLIKSAGFEILDIYGENWKEFNHNNSLSAYFVLKKI